MAEQTKSGFSFDLQSPNNAQPAQEHPETVRESEHTGLFFPTGRVWEKLDEKIADDTSNNFELISSDAAVYLSAVLQHLTSELVQLAGNAAKRSNKTRIEPPDIVKAVKMDHEFSDLFDTKESRSRSSVPASPYDMIDPANLENRYKSITRNPSNLRFWREADNEDNERESAEETECTELETEHKETDEEDATETASVCIINDEEFIAGLYYVENYISKQQHDDIAQCVNGNEWHKRHGQRHIYQEYGHAYSSGHSSSESFVHKLEEKPFDEIPCCMEGVLTEILNEDLIGMPHDYYFDQLTVNNFPSYGAQDYTLEDGDCFGEYIVCLSLLSEAVVNFKHIETNQVKQLLLRPRSVLVLSGDARWKWMHGITEHATQIYDGNVIKRQQRISLTFRKSLHENTKAKYTKQDHPFLLKIDGLLGTINDFLD